MVELKSSKQIYAMKVIKKALVMDEEVRVWAILVFYVFKDGTIKIATLVFKKLLGE